MKLLADRAVNALFSKIAFFTVAFCMASALFFFLLPKKAAVCILISALCMVLCIVAGCYQYLVGQGERIENAAAQITDYISGNTDTRIECDEEGSLCLLFHRINMLASILDARVKREEKARGFLKNIISDISHQLKTPLAALNIYNGILQGEAGDSATLQEFIELSEQELDRVNTLVQNLIKLARLDAGAVVFEREEENVLEMMEEARKRFSFRAVQEEKEISLEGDGRVLLSCDRGWLVEAVGNLVKNALDHTEAGGKIQIKWKQFSSIVQIVVEDNGAGIHPEDLHHIFKRFYRSRFSKDTQGAGLGLPFVKAVAEAQDGTVEVSSKLGKGTAFTINFLRNCKP
ncbi:sensor histidine kinase [bacterium D16-51]|nr:sensor histidine kinase [bacterium D16-59]RKI59613.1 sensor histidine kinase [bacterium D16-51]